MAEGDAAAAEGLAVAGDVAAAAGGGVVDVQQTDCRGSCWCTGVAAAGAVVFAAAAAGSKAAPLDWPQREQTREHPLRDAVHRSDPDLSQGGELQM